MKTLREEIRCAGINEDDEMRVGIDNKYGEILITSIQLKDLLQSVYFRNLTDKHKVLEIKNTENKEPNENKYIFKINIVGY